MAILQPIICDSAEVNGSPALTKEQAEQLFDKMAQRYLKMSTTEFLARLDSGFFNEHPELERRLDSVLFYLPLIRR
jgi:hypothetical protein